MLNLGVTWDSKFAPNVILFCFRLNVSWCPRFSLYFYLSFFLLITLNISLLGVSKSFKNIPVSSSWNQVTDERIINIHAVSGMLRKILCFYLFSCLCSISLYIFDSLYDMIYRVSVCFFTLLSFTRSL